MSTIRENRLSSSKYKKYSKDDCFKFMQHNPKLFALLISKTEEKQFNDDLIFCPNKNDVFLVYFYWYMIYIYTYIYIYIYIYILLQKCFF